MSYVRSFFKNPHLDFSKINAHFTRKHYCRVCLGRKKQNRTPVGEIDFAAFVHDKLTDYTRGVVCQLFIFKFSKLIAPQ